MAKSSLNPDQRRTVTDERLIDELACRVMRWKLGPDRFLKSGRQWIPRWRFQPLINIDDAFQLLEGAAASLVLKTTKDGAHAKVKLGQGIGRASTPFVATSVTVAIARAIGLHVPDGEIASLAAKPSRREAAR